MSKRDRLLQQISETEARWQRLSIRLGKLKLARELETRGEEHLRIDALIDSVEASRLSVDTELELLETQVNQLSPSASLQANATPPLLYWSYAHADEWLRDELARLIATLAGASGLLHYYDRQVPLGAEPKQIAMRQLAKARIILLLVSADYLADDEIDRSEVQPAMQRYAAGEAIVIPIILRACTWDGAPFAKLQVLPKDGVPIQTWPDRQLVLRDVATKIHETTLRLTPIR